LSHEILLRSLQLGEKDEAFAVVGVVKTTGPTAVKAGNKAIIKADGTIEGWVGGHCTEKEILENALNSIKDGEVRLLNLATCHGGMMDVYIEPYLPKRKLIIIGHIPIVSALSRVAKVLGFTVTVVDNGASKETFPEADFVEKEINVSSVNRQTFVVIATMGEFDEEFAERLLSTQTPYIGIVAGKKRAHDIINYLRSRKNAEERISKIRSPAGIYIRAVTAEEIALSIMAEIVETARGKNQTMTQAMPLLTQGSEQGMGEDEEESQQEVGQIFTDPVCGMTVDSITSRFYSKINGKTVFFCCENCKEEFDKNPSKYIIPSPTARPV
jgi:xanthine dehydrogenase accessory factor